MEFRKVCSSDIISFNRINLSPKVADILCKSISVINNYGEIIQLPVDPFMIDGDITIKNTVINSNAVILILDNEFITTEEQLDDSIYISVSRVNHSTIGRIIAKSPKIKHKRYLTPILKAENTVDVVLSAKVGVIGYDEDGFELFNEHVYMGLGDTRELLSHDGVLQYSPYELREYNSGLYNRDNLEFTTNSDGIITVKNINKSSKYIYLPEYALVDKPLVINENITIDKNNNIYISNNHTSHIESSVEVDILDSNTEGVIIKYIGVVSRD